MFISSAMNPLDRWFKEHGSQARKALFLKIKETFPAFSQTSLTQYAKEKRIPEKQIAAIIAEFIGVPLEEIPYRYVHKPADLVPNPYRAGSGGQGGLNREGDTEGAGAQSNKSGKDNGELAFLGPGNGQKLGGLSRILRRLADWTNF